MFEVDRELDAGAGAQFDDALCLGKIHGQASGTQDAANRRVGECAFDDFELLVGRKGDVEDLDPRVGDQACQSATRIGMPCRSAAACALAAVREAMA